MSVQIGNLIVENLTPENPIPALLKRDLNLLRYSTYIDP